MTFALKSNRVVTPDEVRPALVLVDGETIRDILPVDAALGTDVEIVDYGELVLMPGLVDTHVHINEPGRTEWEGFETATRAASAGGVTTLVDMPLNSIPATVDVPALERKLAAAEGRLAVDCGFYGGLVPGNARQLEALIDAGVLGFKSFLCPSGVDEFGHVDESELRDGLPLLARRGVPLLVHAELDASGPEPGAAGDPRAYATYLASRPRRWENEAIEMMTRLAGEFGARVHIVHLSSSDALPLLHSARERKIPLSVETCHHYLSFAAEEIPDGRTEFKCAPPIRERENREKLWEGLRTGQIDFAVSDHSPCLPALKTDEGGDFLKSWGGIAGLQFSLSAFHTAADGRGISLEDTARWLCAAPADFAGLGGRKGRIAPGLDADFAVWDPDARVLVEPEGIYQRHDLTPYAGLRLRGEVRATYLRGRLIYEAAGQAGRFPGGVRGRVLRGPL